MGRLDALVELVFDRYKNRFFVGEKVFVDLGGDKSVSSMEWTQKAADVRRAAFVRPTRYFARIAKLFPPANIRETASSDGAAGLCCQNTVIPPGGGTLVEDEFSRVAHRVGTDLSLDAEQATTKDDPDDYLYTVQLMDEERKFEGSFMELKAKALRWESIAVRAHLLNSSSFLRQSRSTHVLQDRSETIHSRLCPSRSIFKHTMDDQTGRRARLWHRPDSV